MSTTQAGTPQAGTPQAGTPQAGTPQAGTPQEALEAMLLNYCKQLRLPGIRQDYQALIRDAQQQGIPPLRFLVSCLQHEAVARKQRQRQTRIKNAKFPQLKALDAFDFSLIPQLSQAQVLGLAQSDYIEQKQNILCLGPSGTGKTHVAIALGVAAIQTGYRVRFIRTLTLAQELLKAQQEFRLNPYLKSWRKFELVILDELGYLELGPGAPLLFQFVAERSELGSLIVTSNLDFARWEDVFGDPALTTALLDRLTHHCHILVFHGESHRFRQSQHQLKQVHSAKEGQQTLDQDSQPQ